MKTSILIVMIALLGFSSMQAQTIFVKEKTGTQTSYSLSEIRKLSFVSGNVLVSNKSGDEDVFSLPQVRYFNFKDLVTNLPSDYQQMQMGNISVYPNPVYDMLTINFTKAYQGYVEVISIDGKVVLHQPLENNAHNYQLPMSGFSSGLYLCKIVGDGQMRIVKFIKD